jgi:hypothetical protein
LFEFLGLVIKREKIDSAHKDLFISNSMFSEDPLKNHQKKKNIEKCLKK